MADLADRIELGEIKALSVKQPWPHRIFYEGKDVENRDWPTRVRGWVIIHAGKSYDGERPSSHNDLPMGGVVGLARIIDCVTEMDSEWFFGRYGFVLRDPMPLGLIPCRGQLGFFSLPSDVCQQVADAFRARRKVNG